MSYKEVMSLVVFEYKACSLSYFLDEMKMYELDWVMDNLNICAKSSLEVMRNVMWSNLAPNSKHKIKPKDVMEFPWEDSRKKLPKVEVNQELVNKMTKLAKQRKGVMIDSGII